ncbi:hypothetical protein DRJ25_03900 [Candidatus Woesearchaeota archaeon]|nr:MAG: hypothetical protein DRJ25_03900 [Candidatus Woesearchaeota archaeon]
MIHIYSSEQFDGIATSAIIVRYAILKRLDYRVEIIDYQKEISIPEKGNIFFADINPERIDLDRISRQIFFWAAYYPHKKEDQIRKKTRYCFVIQPTSTVYDHFVKKSAAEATFEKLLPQDRIAKEIARLARDIKFWERKDPRAEKLNTLLASDFDKKQLIETIAKGSFWNEKFEQKYQGYTIRRDEALQDMMKTIRVKKYLTTHFGFFLANNILSSADAGHYALEKHKGIDVAVIIFRNGKISFRRREGCSLDLSDIAKLFNGGGHAYAAGGELRKTVTLKNYDNIMFEINQALQDIFIT